MGTKDKKTLTQLSNELFVALNKKPRNDLPEFYKADEYQ